MMSFDGSETTGIESTERAEEDGAIYNLSGIQVNHPTKGIYVKNGKKYVIK